MKQIMLAIIVTWTATWESPGACPSSKDPYTGQIIPNVQMNVCYAKYKNDMRGEFETMEEYEKFKAGCPKGTCSDWKVEK